MFASKVIYEADILEFSAQFAVHLFIVPYYVMVLFSDRTQSFIDGLLSLLSEFVVLRTLYLHLLSYFLVHARYCIVMRC